MFLVLGTLAIVTAIGTVILGLNGKKRGGSPFYQRFPDSPHSLRLLPAGRTVCCKRGLVCADGCDAHWCYPMLDWNRSFHFDQQHQFLYQKEKAVRYSLPGAGRYGQILFNSFFAFSFSNP